METFVSLAESLWIIPDSIYARMSLSMTHIFIDHCGSPQCCISVWGKTFVELKGVRSCYTSQTCRVLELHNQTCLKDTESRSPKTRAWLTPHSPVPATKLKELNLALQAKTEQCSCIVTCFTTCKHLPLWLWASLHSWSKACHCWGKPELAPLKYGHGGDRWFWRQTEDPGLSKRVCCCTVYSVLPQ